MQYIHKIHSERFVWKFRAIPDCVLKTISNGENWKYDLGWFVGISKKCPWVDQFSVGLGENSLQKGSEILILHFNKSVCLKSLWSSWRVSHLKHSTPIFRFRVEVFSSSIRNQVLGRTKFWYPVVNYRHYNVMHFSLLKWQSFNLNVRMINNHIFVLISCKSRYSGLFVPKKKLWFKKTDSLKNSKIAAVFCFKI